MVGLLAAGLLSASCAAGARPPAANADPTGVWTLTGVVDDDGTEHPPDPMAEITYTVDMAARTVVNRCRWKIAGMPEETHTFAFTITPAGNWHVDDAGPDGRKIEFAVECAPASLVLTRVWYEGPGDEVPPPPAYGAGTTPPPAPARVPPPKKFLYGR
jgi:hypothetical protein